MTRRELIGAGLAFGLGMTVSKTGMAQSRKNAKVVRLGTDHFELILPEQKRVRILQITDTHFGTPNEINRAKDLRTQALIRELVATHQPDHIFHTGDFINNDKDYPEFGAIDFMNDLGTPWSVVFGNHDHPSEERGQRPLERYYGTLGNATVGYATRPGGGRDYCYRIDLRIAGQKPFASLFAFNTGSPNTNMIVSPTEARWFQQQMEADRSKGLNTPILVMQHIPTIEYRDVYDQKLAIGRRGENVCYELDRGEIFKQYVESGRVRAIFCGHDHVNDYVGDLQSVKLVYGRCTGYSGYGDWEKGARVIDIDTTTGKGTTHVVLSRKAAEKPDWSKTLAEMPLFG